MEINWPTAVNEETGEVLVQSLDKSKWIPEEEFKGLPPEERYLKTAYNPDTNEQIGFNPVTNEWEKFEEQDIIDYVPLASVERGMRRAGQGIDYAAHSLGLSSDEEYAEAVRKSESKISEEPLTRSQQEQITEVMESDGFADTAYNLATNPQAAGVLIGETLGIATAGAAGAATMTAAGRVVKAGPWAIKAMSGLGFGTSSGMTTASSKFLETLADEGVDVSNEDDVKDFLSDTDKVNKAKVRANLHGMSVGAFDAFSMAIAGLPTKAIVGSKGVSKTSLLAGSALETGVQGTLGMAGEAGGQLLADGKIVNKTEIYLEGLLEGITGVPQAIFQSAITPTEQAQQMVNKPNTIFFEEEVIGDAPVKLPEDKELQGIDQPVKLSKAKKLVRQSNPIVSEEEATVPTHANFVEKLSQDPTTLPEEEVIEAFNTNDFRSFVDKIQPQELQNTDNIQTPQSNFSNLVEDVQPQDLQMRYQKAYHGTPYNFDKFSLNNNRRGQGQNTHGYGLYFTDLKPAAKKYKMNLSVDSAPVTLDRSEPNNIKIRQGDKVLEEGYQNEEQAQQQVEKLGKEKGQLLEVDIPDNEFLLDWDQAVPQQEVERLGIPGISDKQRNVAGADIYRKLQKELGSDKAASDFLSEKGYKGIKYRDRQARPDVEKGNNFVIFDPNSIENVKKHLQQQIKYPQANNSTTFHKDQLWDEMYDDTAVSGMRNPTKTQQRKIKKAYKAVRKVIGDNPNLNIKFVDEIRKFKDPNVSDPVLGFQQGNMIRVALGFADDMGFDDFEISLHETYHLLKRLKTLTTRDQNILDKNVDSLKKYIKDLTNISDTDMNQFIAAGGQEEIEAWAFGLYASRKNQNSDYKSNVLSNNVANIFDRIRQFLRKFGIELKKNDINSISDVFDAALEGNRTADEIFDTNLERMTIKRYQDLGQQIQAMHQAKKTKNAIDLDTQKLKDALEYDERNLNSLTWFGEYVSSMTHLASKSRFFGKVYDTFRERNHIANAIKHKAANDLFTFNKMKRKEQEAIYDLADFMRGTNQKGKLDEQGRLTFKRNGKIVRLKDINASKRFMELQNYYEGVIEGVQVAYKHRMVNKFKDLPEDFTVENLDTLIENADTEAKVKRYENIKETLQSFQKVLSSSYVPHMRYGDLGVTVKDKETGEQIAFYTLERGDKKDSYSKYQYEEVVKTLKEKYDNPKKYRIIGKKDFTGKLDKLEPFIMTKQNVLSEINKSALSLDMYIGLLNSKDVNMEAIETLKEDLIDNMVSRGFGKHMLESQNIDGYSKDWTRVHNQYIGGSSNFIANMLTDDKVNALREVANTGAFKDKKLQKAVQRYIDYMGSPEEDYIEMRMFNFMWTMGGNLSTAVLQFFTLPTLTLGNMSKFRVNPVKNMATISKWGALTTERAVRGRSSQKKGTYSLNFAENFEPLLKENVISQDQFDLIKRADVLNLVGAPLTHEYASEQTFETRTKTGRLRDTGSVVANALGIPISIAEQHSRFVSLMSMYDVLKGTPTEKIMNVLGNDKRFMAMFDSYPDFTPQQIAALYSLDEAHAVFGKEGRSPLQRGIGGALFLPFQTYPQHALESLVRMYGQGPEGKKALAITLGSFAVLSGLIGLPAADLLKELYEEAHKGVTGEEIDLELLIRYAIYEQTGSSELGKFAVHGAPRNMGLDVSRRIGLGFPGADLLLAATGIRGDASDMYGVPGSLLSNTFRAWNDYQNDASLNSTMTQLSPVALSNIFKATGYATDGVSTQRGYQLIAPDDVSAFTLSMRGFGFSSDQIAEARTKKYFTDLIGDKLNPYKERQRERAKKAVTRYMRLVKEGKNAEAQEEYQKFVSIQKELVKRFTDEGLPIDLGAFNRSVIKASNQRIYPSETFTQHLDKLSRLQQNEVGKLFE